MPTSLSKKQGTGTITDVEGNFTLSVPSPGTATLAVSFIGYQTVTRTIKAQNDPTNLTFSLREDVLSLDELVVTGQGEGLSKRRLSTDVATVSSEALEQVPVPRLDLALQTQLPNAHCASPADSPAQHQSSAPVAPCQLLSTRPRSSTWTVFGWITPTRPLPLGLNTSGNPWQGAVTSAIPDIPGREHRAD